MAKKIRAKLVLELLHDGLSGREIRQTRRIAPQSIKKVREAAEERGITWERVEGMSEDDVYDMLFPDQAAAREACAQVDYDYVHAELQKVGVNLTLLYEEYVDEAKAEGLASKSYTTFTRGYSEYVIAKNVTNHLEHKPAQAMEVDWSGAKMRLVDPFTAEVTRVSLFVAVLPYSQCTYVEATLDMKQNTWLKCHVNAWDYFGGVAVRTICDNLKTGVTARPRDGEVVLNDAYEALGRHYRTAIMPTQVRKPKQKASVEGAVGKMATAVIARLRNREFHTLGELNSAIREQLAAFNARPFQKREGSRKLVFDEVESAFLEPLPDVPFEVCDWVYGRTVALNFHVSFEKNCYSVPSRLVGKKVDLKVTDSTVQAYFGGERVASHPRLPGCLSYRYQTDPAHMPAGFDRPAWDEARMTGWAREVGPATADVVARIFGVVDIKEQAYNPVLAVLNLSKAYSEPELEAACEYALTKTPNPRCKFLKTVLASNAAKAKPDEGCDESSSGGYIRGEGYYEGEGV